MATFNDLPNELLILIFKFVPLWHVRKIALLNSQLYRLAKPFLEEDRRLHRKYSSIQCLRDENNHLYWRGILREVVLEPRVAHYINRINASYLDLDKEDLVCTIDLAFFNGVCAASPWIPNDELPIWRAKLEAGLTIDALFSLLLLMLPNLREMRLGLVMPFPGLEVNTICLSSAFRRIAMRSPSMSDGIYPLDSLREVSINAGSLSNVFSILALPSLRSLRICYGLQGREPAWSADLPLSNLTHLHVSGWMHPKTLASVLARINELRDFSYLPSFSRDRQEWSGFGKNIAETYQAHTRATCIQSKIMLWARLRDQWFRDQIITSA